MFSFKTKSEHSLNMWGFTKHIKNWSSVTQDSGGEGLFIKLYCWQIAIFEKQGEAAFINDVISELASAVGKQLL